MKLEDAYIPSLAVSLLDTGSIHRVDLGLALPILGHNAFGVVKTHDMGMDAGLLYSWTTGEPITQRRI